MSKWKMVRLGDAATFINGFPFKPTDWANEGLPIIRIQNLTGSSEAVNYYDEHYDTKYEVNNGDILISWSASLGVYMWCHGKALLNQHIFKVVFDKLDYDRRFFMYIINQKLGEMSTATHGSTMKHITKKHFDAIKIPLPPLDVQQKIANVLDKASVLIELRKTQIDKLDLLVKSQFIEMFGDVVQNEKGWPQTSIGDVAEIKIGPFGTLLHKEDYIEAGHALVNPSHIEDGKICIDTKLTITNDKYKELAAYQLKKGDIVLGRRGEMGRCAVVYEDGLLCGTGSMIIRCGQKIKPYFLQNILSSPTYKKIIEDKAVGVTMMNLNVRIVEGLQIPLLPIELQKKFISFMEQVDKSKFEIQKSLEKLETLKKALVQEYFGG